MKDIYFGIDMALNTTGIVALDSVGKVKGLCYITNKKKFLLKSIPSFLIPDRAKNIKGGMSQEQYHFYRIEYNCQVISKYISSVVSDILHLENIYINIEHYAFSSKSMSSYQIHECGGVVRNFLLFNEFLNGRGSLIKVYLRQTDPMSLKMWVIKGNCSKSGMVRKAKEAGLKIPDRLIERGKKDWEGPGTDISDAFHLADLVYNEVQVKRGEKILSDFSENQVRVFNRIDCLGGNIFDRDFIIQPEIDTDSIDQTLFSEFL